MLLIVIECYWFYLVVHSEFSRQSQQVILDSLRHAHMTFGAGMKTICLGIVEIAGMFVKHRHQAALAIEVNHRHAPNLAAAADGCRIILDVEAKEVCVHLVGLNVTGTESREGPVERGHNDYLLRRECGLEIMHQNVAAAAEGVPVIIEATVQLRGNTAVGVDGIHSLSEPLAHRHVVEEIVGACKDDYGVEGGIDFLSLGRQLDHLIAVDGKRNGLHIHQLCKELPPAFAGPDPYRVADGITKDSHLCATPLTLGVDRHENSQKCCQNCYEFSL